MASLVTANSYRQAGVSVLVTVLAPIACSGTGITPTFAEHTYIHTSEHAVV